MKFIIHSRIHDDSPSERLSESLVLQDRRHERNLERNDIHSLVNGDKLTPEGRSSWNKEHNLMASVSQLHNGKTMEKFRIRLNDKTEVNRKR